MGVDPDGIEQIGGDLDAVLEVADLVDSGWDVDGPVVEGDGYTRVRFGRAFADDAQAAAIFEDIAGEDGPFQDLAVRRESSFARTAWGFSGRLDFSGGLEAFGDAGLAAELDGEPLGQSVEEIEAQLGESLGEVIEVRVAVRLPGELSSNAPAGTDEEAVWQVGFGDGTVAMEATGEERRTASLIAIGVSLTCAVLLLVYGLVRFGGRARAKRRRVHMADEAA